MPTRPIGPTELRAALAPTRAWLHDGPEPSRRDLATAVRVSLRALAQAAPGHAVEVRVPPFAAVQCLAGGVHTRGTPPHVVEADARHWLELATGLMTWDAALATGSVRASGHRAGEVAAHLPLSCDSA